MEKLNSDLHSRILTARVFKEQEAFYVTNIYAPAGAQKRSKTTFSLKAYIHTSRQMDQLY